MALACMMLAPGAGDSHVGRPIQPLKWQYHCGPGAGGAFRAARGAQGGVAVSRKPHPAVSRSELLRIHVEIDDSIARSKCPTIQSRIVVTKPGLRTLYSGVEVVSQSHSTTRTAQYQKPPKRYQPGAIEELSAKSARAARARRDDSALMLKIGLVLGLAYVVFLTLWIWATRVRPRRPRGI